ncbi:MAG: peptidogalycan biosysnthesis protein, partial [Roseococcus sp.]
VEAGAQGEHKIQRGYLPVPTYSAHWIAHPGLSRAVADFLERERPAMRREMAELATLSPFRREGEE